MTEQKTPKEPYRAPTEEEVDRWLETHQSPFPEMPFSRHTARILWGMERGYPPDDEFESPQPTLTATGQED